LWRAAFRNATNRSCAAPSSGGAVIPDADCWYLFALTGRSPPATSATSGPDEALLQSLVDRVAAPAYCTDALTSALAWNGLAVDVFGDYGHWPAERRNLLRLFEEPTFAVRLVDRDECAARVVHTFRGRSDAYLNDPAAIDLVDSLTRGNPGSRPCGTRRTSASMPTYRPTRSEHPGSAPVPDPSAHIMAAWAPSRSESLPGAVSAGVSRDQCSGS
jgi:hypothetical protein